MLGHGSVMITLDRYGHLYPGDTHQYAERLAELTREVRAQDHADWVRTETSDRLVAVPRVAGGKGL